MIRVRYAQDSKHFGEEFRARTLRAAVARIKVYDYNPKTGTYHRAKPKVLRVTLHGYRRVWEVSAPGTGTVIADVFDEASRYGSWGDGEFGKLTPRQAAEQKRIEAHLRKLQQKAMQRNARLMKKQRRRR